MSVSHIRGRKALTSWKEIAQYLDTSVRTAHRWKDKGMPVHTSARGAPLAYADELDEWLKLPSRPTTETTTRRNRIWLPMVLVIVVLGVCGALWVTTRAGLPVRLVIHDQGIQAIDANGRQCWNYEIPNLQTSNQWGLGVYQPQVFLIEDIDRDGKLEVVFNRMPPFDSEASGSLYCFEADGRLRWHVELGQSLAWDGRNYRRDHVGVLLRSLQAAGKSYLLSVAGHRRWAPCQVALLDPATGSAVEEFWHPGTLTHGIVQDIDGDGQPEVLLAGLNNPGTANGRAALLGLRVPFSRVPVNPRSLLGDFSSGGPFKYVLFPRSDLSSRLGVVALVTHLWFDLPETIHLVIRSTEDKAGVLTYLFQPTLALREYLWTPDLPFRHDQLWKQGFLNHPMSEAEAACLGKVLTLDMVPNGNDPALHDRWKACEASALDPPTPATAAK
jgi:hypothetical protein